MKKITSAGYLLLFMVSLGATNLFSAANRLDIHYYDGSGNALTVGLNDAFVTNWLDSFGGVEALKNSDLYGLAVNQLEHQGAVLDLDGVRFSVIRVSFEPDPEFWEDLGVVPPNPADYADLRNYREYPITHDLRNDGELVSDAIKDAFLNHKVFVRADLR